MRSEVQALLRKDFLSFLHKAFVTVEPSVKFRPNWHHQAIAHALSEVADGTCRRLMINQPPRSLKSICASVAYPAWLLGREPGLEILCVSYGSDLAQDLHRKFRIVVDSDWYRAVFPNVSWRRQTDAQHLTSENGCRLAVSVGGQLTGRGGDIIILDDPLKPDEAASDAERNRVNNWYGDTLVSRTNQKHNDRIVIVMQRLHEDDLCGYLLEKDKERRWSQLVLPARASADQPVPIGPNRIHHRKFNEVLDQEREPEDVLKRIEGEQGSRIFAAQYQQEPTPGTGNLVDITRFRSYTGSPPCSEYGPSIVQSWDTASKVNDSNDYSVCTTWQIWGEDAYLLDVFRDRLEYPRLRQMVEALATRFKPRTLLIEDSSAGMHILADLRHKPIPGVPRPESVPIKGDKKMQFEAHSFLIEAGHVLLPEDAPWKAPYLKELAAFPRGKYDDQVDSTAQFFAWFRRPRLNSVAGSEVMVFY